MENNYYAKIYPNSLKAAIDGQIIFSFNDNDGHNGDKRGYANYITKDELKNLAMFILSYLDKYPKVDNY